MGNANATARADGGEPMQSSHSQVLNDSDTGRGSADDLFVMFAPQVPTAPISKPAYESIIHNEEGREKTFPSLIVWNHGGNSVSVEGSWDNWTTRQALERSGNDFSILKFLPAGVYQYKFLVDGESKYSPDFPFNEGESEDITNVLEIQDYVADNLENLAAFDPPPSPESSYNSTYPTAEEFAKEPPSLPSHLHLTLLNVPSSVDAPRPQHVILNHLYMEKSRGTHSVLALGATHRFRSKYVTVVIYRPLPTK